MAIIQIKRIQTHPYGLDGADLLEALRDGELGYVIDENKLYIGSNKGNILINDSSGLGPLIEEIKTSGVGKIEWNPNTLQLKVYDLENSPVSSKHVTLTHTHKYAGSASAGGAANSAIKLIAADGSEVIVGSDTQPVYFSNGTPVACGDTLDVNISKNAATASHLAESRTFTINGTAADGGTSFNGSTDAALKLPKILNGFTSITANKFIGNIEGKATSADKLSTNAGTSSKPVYFANGIPVICDNELDVSIKGQAQLAAQLATGRTISINGEAGTTGTEFNGSKNIGLTIPKTLTGLTSITSSKFIGDLEGNASTATAFQSTQDINLSGDVTGSASSTGGWAITTELTNIHSAEGQGGPTADGTLEHGKTFTVPYFEYDKKGRIVGVVDRTFTLPKDNNTDTKVTQKAVITTAGEYPVMLGYDTRTTSVTNTVNKAAAFTYNPDTKTLTAPKFKGQLIGNADTASTWETERAFTINSTAANGGVNVDGSKNIALNIPTSINGFASITSTKFIGDLQGTADEAKKLTSSAGSNVKPIYFAEGVPVECSDSLDVNINKNAATADHWKNTITLTYKNDVTGSVSFDGSTNKDVTLTLKNSGVTAGTYGPAANKTLDFGEGFDVPKYTVDAKGRLTSTSTVTYTLPSIDAYVNNLKNKTIVPDEKTYTFNALSDLSFNQTDNQINVTENEYILNLEDFAFTEEVESKIEAIPKPMIFKGTVGTGGTKTTLPTADASTIGHTYRVVSSLTVDGTTSTPGDLWICAKISENPDTYKWVHVVNTDETHVASAAQANKWTTARKFTISGTPSGSTASVDGSKDITLYLPKTIGKFDKVSATSFEGALTGNATTATTASKLGTNAGSATKPVYFANGVPQECGSTLGVNISGTSAGWTTARTLSLTGPVTGSASIDGTKAITVATTIDDIYLFNSGDTITGHLTMSNDKAQSEQPALKWKTIGAASPFVGYATDQTDGTFALMSIEGTNYASGLAIGGNSKNLLWKGVKVATVESTVAAASALETGRKISISGTPGTSGTMFNGSKDISLVLPKTIGKFDKVSATSFEGALSGNASSATEFSSNATVKLTGAITGEASSKKGWEIATTLASIHATGGSGGPTTDPSGTPLAHSGTFTVPYFEYDAQGRITSVIDRTYKLPTDNNTDTKVTQAYSTANNSYPLLFTNTAGITSTSSRGATTAILNNSIYANPSTGTITATKFKGALEGNASSATALATGRKISISGTPGTSGTTFDGSKAISLILPETIGTFKSVSATSFTGDLAGNASSADAFSSDALVKLTGDVIGEVSSTKGWTVDTTLKELHSGGNGGPTANATLSHKGTFTVPYFEYDKNGRITSVVDRTYTLPSDNNTDTKVTQAAAITTKAEYPIILGYSTATTAVTNTVNKASTLTYNPGDQILTAPKFKGDLTGTADSAKQWSENRKFKINKTAAYNNETDKNPIEVNVNGSTDIALTVPAEMTGFKSITSDKFVGQASRALKFETYINSSKTATYGNQWQVAAYWETGSGPIRLASDQQADKYKVKVDQADLADKATIADTADKWTTARTFTFKGDVSGTLTMDGSQSLDCTLTVANDSHSHSNYLLNTLTNIELNSSDSNKLKGYGGFIDFHFINADGNPTDSAGNVVSARPDYTSRIVENAPGQLSINGTLFKNNVVTATKFKGAFDGNASTASMWANSRNFTISDYTDTNQGINSAVNGSANVDLKMPKNVEVSTITVNKSETTGTGVKMEFDTVDESLMFVFA